MYTLPFCSTHYDHRKHKPSGRVLQYVLTRALVILVLSMCTLSSAYALPSSVLETGELLSIEEAVEYTKSNNASLQTGQLRLSAAHMFTKQAWSYLLPTLNAQGGWIHNDKEVVVPLGLPPQLKPLFDGAGLDFPPAQNIVIQEQEQFQASLRFDWVLLSGRSIPLIKYAYRGADKAEAGYALLEATMVTATMFAYHNVVGGQEQVRIRERSLKSAQRHFRLAEARFELGSAQEVEKLRAEVEVASAEQTLQLARNGLRKGKLALATLMGIVNQDGTFPEFRVQVSSKTGMTMEPDNRLTLALSERFDLKEAHYNAVMAGYLTTETWMRFLPQLLATGQWRWLNAKGFRNENTAWNVGLMLQWELFSGGDTYFGWKKLQITEAAAKSAVNEMQVKIRQQVREAEIVFDSAKASVVLARRRMELAERSAVLIDAQYEVGAVTQLEVLDAHRGRDDADTAAVLAQLEVDVAAVALERVVFSPVP